jgi:hypothetical protein
MDPHTFACLLLSFSYFFPYIFLGRWTYGSHGE